jgi:hypothetical protein
MPLKEKIVGSIAVIRAQFPIAVYGHAMHAKMRLGAKRKKARWKPPWN